MKINKRLSLKNTIFQHILNNKKEYILVTLIFIIGIFAGVMFINNIQEAQMTEIETYFNDFTEKFKNIEEIDNIKLLKSTILENIILAVILWFFGTTVIGIPIVFGIILYRGFCLGYTISTIIIVMGVGKGILFILASLLLQNIIFIPCMIAIGVSGFKLYKSIVKDKNKYNIKVEVLRHTVFSSIMLGFICLASVIEILLSTNILKKIIKYF